VTTALQYLVFAAVIGLVVFGLAVFVFGRGEQLAPLSPRRSPTELPEKALSAEDVRKVRFAMAVRGYRMSDVDWALEQMADELDRLHARISALSSDPAADDDSGHPPAADPDAVLSGLAQAGAGRNKQLPTDPGAGVPS